jgi:phenylacetate-CoA ligase
MDYGLTEFEPVPDVEPADAKSRVMEIVGTSLYNRAMPLVRYRTGDYVRVSTVPAACPCGRGFPVVDSILGRQADVVITPDRRAVTALYVVLDRTPGVLLGQILQDGIDHLRLRIACDPRQRRRIDAALRSQLRQFLGPDMRTDFTYETVEEILRDHHNKFQAIRSQIPCETMIH